MITLAQLLLAVSIPTLVGLVGVVFGQIGYHRLDDKVERMSAQQHNDMMMIQSVLRDHGERLSKMEPR